MLQIPHNAQENTQDFTAIQQLSRQDRIEVLYTHTPHSLSRVCLQLVEVGKATLQPASDTVDDIAAAVMFFWRKGQMWDKRAIETLWRFSTHIVWSGRLRFAFCRDLWNEEKAYFDNTMFDTYKEALWLLYTKPAYTPYVKKTSHEISNVLSEANRIAQKDNEQY